MPNKLPRGRLFLCSESMNNGDEKEVGLEIMWTGRRQPTGTLSEPAAEVDGLMVVVDGENSLTLRPPTAPVASLRLNLARQGC